MVLDRNFSLNVHRLTLSEIQDADVRRRHLFIETRHGTMPSFRGGEKMLAASGVTRK
jgi:hypothetical protein